MSMLSTQIPNAMRSYMFAVTLEPDGDGFHAYCPALRAEGASTWGQTENEALAHIREVAQMIVDEMVEEGADPALLDGVRVTEGAVVAVAR